MKNSSIKILYALTFIIILIGTSNSAFSQPNCTELRNILARKLKVTKNMKVIPFKGNFDDYGLKKKSKDSIIVDAKYKAIIENYNDSIFIVQSKTTELAVINLNGEIIEPFISGFYMFNTSDKRIDYGSILVIRFCINNNPNNIIYRINDKGECVVSDYFPCPYGVPLSDSILPGHLSYIQEAVKYKNFDIDKAIEFYKLAIKSDSSNSATYFTAIDCFMNDYRFLNEFDCKKFENHLSFYEYCIKKAIELEKDTNCLLDLNRFKRNFYNHCIRNEEEVKTAKKEICRLKKLIRKMDDKL